MSWEYGLRWKRTPYALVKEDGQDMETDFVNIIWSKPVRVNEREVYFIGGHMPDV